MVVLGFFEGQVYYSYVFFLFLRLNVVALIMYRGGMLTGMAICPSCKPSIGYPDEFILNHRLICILQSTMLSCGQLLVLFQNFSMLDLFLHQSRELEEPSVDQVVHFWVIW